MSNDALNKQDLLAKREVLGGEHIPYVRHVDAHTIALTNGELMSLIEVGGLPHECAGMSDINAHHRMLNGLWLNLADERVGLSSVLIRRRVQEYQRADFGNEFAARLDARYGDRMNGMSLYRNRLFLAVLRLAPADPVSRTAGRLRKSSVPVISEDDLARHKDKVLGLTAGLAGIGPRMLGLVQRNGLIWSEITTVLHWMLGGRQPAVPLTMGPVWSAAYQDRLVFGRETIEIRHPERTEYAGIFGIKEYPSTTRPTLTDELLTAPMELMAVHSFCFKAKAAARELMRRRINQITSSRDNARKQVPLVAHAIEELADNKFCMGEHQGSVTIFADSPKALADRMAQARSFLMHGGAIVVREDMNLEAAFWAQLPGNLRYRARRGFVTSRNFAALAPFHGFPSGQADGNVWGPAVAMLRTSSGAPFHFNWHVADLGNTFICGPSGSGKTVVLNFLLAQSLKLRPRIVVFDKDRGCELFVRAAGGTYLTLKAGVPTGCAPLKALPITAQTTVWFVRWIEALAGGTLSAAERASIPMALAALAETPTALRSIAGLRTYLDNASIEGLSARLARWQRGGPLGWVFDADEDHLSLDGRFFGFDMTEVLDLPEVRAPLMDYLFHRIEKLIDGERLIIAIDEFWKALDDTGFQAFVQDRLKTIRKQNGLIVFATQSPRDALRSPIAHTIIEQCPTQIFMPNSKAAPEDYRQGMKLSEREYQLVAEVLSAGSRRFLVKQNQAGVVAELNLSGFDEELTILSGRTRTVELLDEIRAAVGDDPARWMQALYARMKAAA